MGSRTVKDFLVGALVGIMSMLPGASGGTIAVVFGIYERLIADIADIRHKLLKDLRFIIPLGVGIVIGLLVCAVGIDALLHDWEVPMMFFFAALIVCQLPDIYSMGNREDDGRPTGWNIVACIIGIVVMVAFLFVGEDDSSISLMDMAATDIVLLFIVGIVIALSKIVPGMSGAAILLAIGLYTPLMDLIGNMDISTLMDRIVALVPIGVGFIVGAIGLAKIVDFFLRNHRRSSYLCILGMTLGSIVTVVVQAAGGVDGTTTILASVVAIVIGLVIGYLLTKISTKYAKETIEGEPGE